MSPRYWAFVGVIALGVCATFIFTDNGRAASPQARAVVLLPEALGGRHIRERWNNPRPLRTLEQGALYAGLGPHPDVQLDFFRNSPSRHNGAVCYTVQGESVLWDRPQVLPLKQGRAQFDVVLLRGMNQLRIVAATECGVEGCAETDLRDLLTPAGMRVRLDVLDTYQARWSLVPVSVTMLRTVSPADDDYAVGAQMEQELKDALRDIDLNPARRLAGLQAAQ